MYSALRLQPYPPRAGTCALFIGVIQGLWWGESIPLYAGIPGVSQPNRNLLIAHAQNTPESVTFGGIRTKIRHEAMEPSGHLQIFKQLKDGRLIIVMQIVGSTALGSFEIWLIAPFLLHYKLIKFRRLFWEIWLLNVFRCSRLYRRVSRWCFNTSNITFSR